MVYTPTYVRLSISSSCNESVKIRLVIEADIISATLVLLNE